MAITHFGEALAPADNSSQAGPGPLAVTPPASMVAGDLVILTAQYRGTAVAITISETGGQSWATEPEIENTNITGQLFWCRFNGTWSANPSVTNTTGANGLSVHMDVYRPSDGAKQWAVDVALVELDFTAPSTPFTVTITGVTTTQASTVAVAVWMTADDNTWGTLAGTGWSKTGLSAQQRNLTGQDQSQTWAYRIQTSAGATNNVSQNQATLGGDAGTTLIIAFYEFDPPPFVAVEYPSYLNPAAALITAAHLAYSGPVEAPTVPAPDQFPTIFPERIVRPSYSAPQQPYAPTFDPQPERDSPFWTVEFPERVRRDAYLAAEQSPWTYGEEPIVPPFVQDTQLVYYPDSVDRPAFATVEQLFATELSPQPERDSPFWSVAFPDRIDRPTFSAREQPFAPWLDPQPERTSPLAWEQAPDAVQRRFYPTATQQPFALGEPTFVAPAPDQFPVSYPDSVTRPEYAAHSQQAHVFGQPPITPPEFVQDTQLVWFADRVVRPSFPVREQLTVTGLAPPPVAPPPDQFPTVYPDSVFRWAYPAYAQQDLAFGQPPIVPPPAPDQFPTLYPERVPRWAYPVTAQAAFTFGLDVSTLAPPFSPVLARIEGGTIIEPFPQISSGTTMRVAPRSTSKIL